MLFDPYPALRAGPTNAPNRRRVVVGLSCALGAPVLLAQTPRRIAFLSGGTQSDAVHLLAALLSELQVIGYREGWDFILEARYANYSAATATALAGELAQLKPVLIFANGGGIAPATGLRPSIPVVFVHSGNPVDAGFADSLARPGRNATGISMLALDLISKRMELLKEIKPTMRRVAFFNSPEHAGQQRELAASLDAARRVGVEVTNYMVRTPAEVELALAQIAPNPPDAALLFSDALMVGMRNKLAVFFLRHRIPSAAGWAAFPEAGHLLSYGAERTAIWRRAAYFVDRILKGAQPADLPIELPTVIEMVVNRRTANAMNLMLPPGILIRADKVIDAPVAG